MQDLHVVSGQNCLALSNGALNAFGVSLMLFTGKWMKLFTETPVVFNMHFQHYKTHCTERPSAPFERALKFGLESRLGFYIYTLYLYMITAFEGHGNAYKPVHIYACRRDEIGWPL
jgi:hypothetical protein